MRWNAYYNSINNELIIIKITHGTRLWLTPIVLRSNGWKSLNAYWRIIFLRMDKNWVQSVQRVLLLVLCTHLPERAKTDFLNTRRVLNVDRPTRWHNTLVNISTDATQTPKIQYFELIRIWYSVADLESKLGEGIEKFIFIIYL